MTIRQKALCFLVSGAAIVLVASACGVGADESAMTLGTAQAALSVCGNNTTEPGEECDGTDQECAYMSGEYCGSDCLCHNGCGDGVCAWNENFQSCPADCPNPNACGEEICDPSWQFCCDHWLAPTCQPYGTYCQN